MAKKIHYHITVAAQSFYLEEQSSPERERYVFAYTVLIQNQGNIAAKLQIHSAAGLTIYAIVNKLVELSEIKDTITQEG